MAESAGAQFNSLVSLYLSPTLRNLPQEAGRAELEVRFGTRGFRKISQVQYDQVIQRIKSAGFTTKASEKMLRISLQDPEYRSVRVQLKGQNAISEYCKTDSIVRPDNSVYATFEIKEYFKESKQIIRYADFDNFNFRVALQNERAIPLDDELVRRMVSEWNDSKKTFRYINRVSLVHDVYPVKIDFSVVKSSKKRGRQYISTYKFLDADVLKQPEIYEIEIEVDQSKVGPDTQYSTPDKLMQVIKKMIKYILQGLQGTNYPVGYDEQDDIIQKYAKLISTDKKYEPRRIFPRDFIGPSSSTLQLSNVVPFDDKSNVPNIRKNYTVTDKADGTRKLLYIARDRKIYLIDMNMNVQFTGVKTETDNLEETILDGEHILHNKSGQFINLFAAFDVYFVNSNDVRAAPFIPVEKQDEAKEKEEEKISRLPTLARIINNLNIKGVKGANDLIRIEQKKFYSTTLQQTIFQACNKVLQNENDGLFEYNTDGLIFTPTELGVGMNKIGGKPKSRKVTWEHSFKWKPPEHNTIDFLVSVIKTKSGIDDIKNIFQKGKDMGVSSQLTQYKTLILRVGYDEKKHGYLNPCEMVINGGKSTDDVSDVDTSYRPVQFYPSNPSDKDAGICNIVLTHGAGNSKLMLSENKEVIEDNMIVEFRYDNTKDAKWRWIPIRVRYDKTAELRGGGRNFGNAYHVANSNWHSLHNPVTALMLKSGQNIPDELDDVDIYYNKKSGANSTQALRNFHNLYVKKKLITSVSKAGDTLIDMAVGKGGDISKWIAAKLKFVFGIDISRDNIENRKDGACVRYLNTKAKFPTTIPAALFVQGNSILNIKNGDAIISDSSKKITKAVFGIGARDKKTLGLVPYEMYGEGENGFNISSIQFAIHYMWENLETLHGFLRNVSETTRVGGYFIGTSYNGEEIFKQLASKKINDSITIANGDEKIWSITKKYDKSVYNPNSSCVGYAIDVYQESINKTAREYLVNYTYLNQLMENYGFVLLTAAEANQIGFPNSVGTFQDLFAKMKSDIKEYPKTRNDYGKALQMTANERRISFLNNYFIYKKVRAVDAEAISTHSINKTLAEELSIQQETDRAREAVAATLVSRAVTEQSQTKPKTIKIKRKYKLKKKKTTT